MAARRASSRKAAVRVDTQYHCRDCAHSHDWRFIAHDGHMILGRCPFHKDDKFHKFLSDPQCGHFELRKGEQGQDNG